MLQNALLLAVHRGLYANVNFFLFVAVVLFLNLPLTSSVVKFGWMVNVYRIGLTLFGKFGKNHGNGSPFVAIGLNGNELL